MSGLDRNAVEAAWLAHDNACPGEHWKKRERMEAGIRAYLSAVGQKAGTAEAVVSTDVVLAAIREYDLTDNLAGKAETMGRHAAVRGLMVRLGLYEAFNAALADDGAALIPAPSPVVPSGLEALVERLRERARTKNGSTIFETDEHSVGFYGSPEAAFDMVVADALSAASRLSATKEKADG